MARIFPDESPGAVRGICHLYKVLNNSLPKSRRHAARFVACSIPAVGSGYRCNTHWRVFGQANGADGYCAQIRTFPIAAGERVTHNCQNWENARTAAAVNAC